MNNKNPNHYTIRTMKVKIYDFACSKQEEQKYSFTSPKKSHLLFQ